MLTALRPRALAALTFRPLQPLLCPLSSSSLRGTEFLNVEEVEKVLHDVKADDVRVIPVRGQCEWANFMIVASGRSTWHVRNISQALIHKIKQKQKGVDQLLLPTVQGREGGQWIVIDSGTLVIHALHEKARAYYDLESLWAMDKTPKWPNQLNNQESDRAWAAPEADQSEWRGGAAQLLVNDHCEGKAPDFEFHLTKPDASQIGVDCDFTGPNVVHDLVEAVILPTQRAYYEGYGQELPWLLSFGLEGLMQFLMAKRLDAGATDVQQSKDFRLTLGKLDQCKEDILHLEGLLRESEEKAVASVEMSVAELVLVEGLQAQRLQDHARITDQEKQLAAIKNGFALTKSMMPPEIPHF